MMPMSSSLWFSLRRNRACLLSFLLAFLLFGVFVVFLRLPVLENDFWGVLFYGRHLTWAARESFYNGFFPIGYAFLLRLLPYERIIPAAFLVNLCFGGLLAASLVSLVTAAKPQAGWGIAAFALTVSFPLVFRYVLVIGADLGAAALAALGISLLWKAPLAGQQDESRFRPFLAGALLGLSTLWRGHLVVFSLAALLSFWLIQKPPLAYMAKTLTAFLLVAGIQSLVNVFAGRGPLETAQAFNIYKAFRDVDWRNPPSEEQIRQFSLLELIASRPQWFFARYKILFAPFLPMFLPPLVLLIAATRPAFTRFAAFSFLSVLLYSLPVALGESPRGPLPLASLAIVCALLVWMAFLERFPKWTRPLTAISALFFVAVLLLLWSRNAAFLREARQRDAVPRRVERILLGAGLQSPRQAFTDHFNIYFHIPPYEPRYSGGWGHYSLWGYAEENPALPLTSWEAFRAACAEQGIQYLVLSPKSNILAGFLHEIYLTDGNDAVELIGTSGNLKIFRFSQPLSAVGRIANPTYVWTRSLMGEPTYGLEAAP